MSEKKRYWLKLEKDFLKSPQMKVIRAMPNGKDYIIFYLALMLESIETVGHLRFTDMVPYNEEMLSAITDTNIDIVRSAVKIFCELGLMQVLDDGTFFMTQVARMTGKECESAERVRRFRAKNCEKALHVTLDVTKCNDNKEKEKQRRERETENRKNKQEHTSCSPHDEHFEKIWSLYPRKRGKGAVKATQRKKLMKISVEEMGRAIDRYVKELSKEEWRKPQNGSTFFNGGYVDYIDENYTPEENKPALPKKSALEVLLEQERAKERINCE